MKRIKMCSLWLLLLVFLAGAVFTGWNFYRETKPDLVSQQYYDSLLEQYKLGNETDDVLQKPEDWFLDFGHLKQEIPDLVGWIYSPGTVIHYPIVQGRDNQYYLEHLADGTPNRNGAVFMDYRNSPVLEDTLTVLYGHHIRGGRMFSSLEEYKSQEYYESHPVLYLYTPDSAYEILLFAGVVTDGAAETFPLKMDREETKDWLSGLKQRSDFRADWKPDPQARWIALCTCTYDYSNARYVVYGQLQELEKSPSVKMEGDEETYE